MENFSVFLDRVTLDDFILGERDESSQRWAETEIIVFEGTRRQLFMVHDE